MINNLFNIYSPLILWTALGILLFRFIPKALPRWLGRALYWIGVPIEILALARKTDFSGNWGLTPLVTLVALTLGLGLSCLCWQILPSLVLLKPDQTWFNRARQGSFVLAAMLGNTGFVGLAIAPSLIHPESLNIPVFYSIAHNLFGPYVFGVLVASYFGRKQSEHRWWLNLRDLLIVPCLWTFILGYFTQSIQFPDFIESGLEASIGIVSCSAFLLIGIRLALLSGWKSFRMALIASSLRVAIVPALVGIGTTLLGIKGDPRLALVLMSGMPSAFMGLILAEEYDLDRELIASSIFLTTVMLLLMIPLWLFLFGYSQAL
ncbi:MAG TPA: transporter [Cyanobacteria bacterium UBA11369]|nr:transporter [Cyanobacteria bacterium UBA11371]HBE33349.1 transporter [Cyanobacteria bacterium UBA11368]HBE47896.1 transporter [Cyanobacteria bacterium UBA11369]